MYGNAKAGNFHKVIALGEGPIDAIEELWIDDTQVTVNGSHMVQTAPWVDKCRIETRLGAATKAHYSDLSAAFAEWTSAHRGDGIASLYAKQFAVSDSDYLATFPNGVNTAYRVVLRGARVENPVTAITAWNDNAAAVIRDYLTHDGDGEKVSSAVRPHGWRNHRLANRWRSA